jgi:acyl-coenzyme A synthetase/AMP-(fatty) acid ligase
MGSIVALPYGLDCVRHSLVISTDMSSIVDRVKELIKYKGFQVPPADLEATLLNHPDIADAGVVGIYSDEQATELPRAYVVPANKEMGESERKEFARGVIEWVAEWVGNHKRLRGGVELVDVIPKS